MTRKAKYLLLLVLCLVLAGCGKAGQPEPGKVIPKAVQNYSRNADLAEALDAIKALEKTAPESAGLWQAILENWDYMNREMPIPYDALPEGLPEDDSLCIVVLGYQLNPDGSMQQELLNRLEAARDCAMQYPNACVLVTGGGTASGSQTTEADEMAGWLAQQGIPEARIIVENRSLTTAQNAKFSAGILNEQYPQVHSVAIVTSDYHIPWGAVLFETQFLLDGGETHVTSCAACTPPAHPNYNIPAAQATGILELAGGKW